MVERRVVERDVVEEVERLSGEAVVPISVGADGGTDGCVRAAAVFVSGHAARGESVAAVAATLEVSGV